MADAKLCSWLPHSLLNWESYEELHDDIMNPRPPSKKDYRGYGEEEDWEYADQMGGANNGAAKSSKHKTKTVSINPTEGRHDSC
jgi:hypothetical protein